MTHLLGSLLAILQTNLAPVFVLATLGWVVQRRFGLDARTLTRLNLWIFVPALTIDRLSHAKLSGEQLLHVAGFSLLLMVLGLVCCRAWCAARGYSVTLAAAFTCSVIFYNSGNFGLPVMELVFGKDSPAAALQAIVVAVQNTATFSLGQILIRGPQLGARRALVEYFKMPFLYAITLGLVLQRTGWELPSVLARPIATAADGLVPVALITLGAQLAQVRWSGSKRPVAVATVMRLVASPVVAFALLKALGWHGLLAQQLLMSSAVPTAVNTALLAIEFDNEPDFAAQTVFVTTTLCAVTMAITILVAQRCFA